VRFCGGRIRDEMGGKDGSQASRHGAVPQEWASPRDSAKRLADRAGAWSVRGPGRGGLIYLCSLKRAVFCATVCHFVPIRGAAPQAAGNGPNERTVAHRPGSAH
jgi:hypothetical protein